MQLKMQHTCYNAALPCKTSFPMRHRKAIADLSAAETRKELPVMHFECNFKVSNIFPPHTKCNAA